jgi:hypothetical protein
MRWGVSGKGPELLGMRRTGATSSPRTLHVLGFRQSLHMTHNGITHEARAANEQD